MDSQGAGKRGAALWPGEPRWDLRRGRQRKERDLAILHMLALGEDNLIAGPSEPE